MNTASKETPLIRQYRDIKAQYADAIVFFRLGDFYEMFEADAVTAARELELTLTSRGGKSDETRMPMCGFPHHSAENYIHKLIKRGYKVAVCEQVEDPATAVGLTKREVVRVLTPGTIDNPEQLSQRTHNFLMALAWDGTELAQATQVALVYADVSTGEAYATIVPDVAALKDELLRVQPSEILVPVANEALSSAVQSVCSVTLTPTWLGKLQTLKARIRGDASSWQQPCLQQAFVMLLHYLAETSKASETNLASIQMYQSAQFMHLDAATRRNLELTESGLGDKTKLTLFDVLNHTQTAMGARLLKQYLHWPLLQTALISERQAAVAELTEDLVLREELRAFLKDVYDIRRLSSRLSQQRANPRDLLALARSLQVLPHLAAALSAASAPLLAETYQCFVAATDLSELAQRITASLVAEPPILLTEGGIMAVGVNAQLDELRQANTDGKSWLAAFESSEREATGIKNLKIGYNGVFGYFLEVSKSNLSAVPAHYIRKQTLSTGERFITEALKEKESFLLSASDRQKKLEYDLFVQLRNFAAGLVDRLYQVSEHIARVDVLLSLAECAVAHQWTRPQVLDAADFQIVAGRHPVVEHVLPRGAFVPNPTQLSREGCRFMLLTGPNMSGKSTYLRQIGLIVLLAHMGSFVPAQSASLPLVDRIFTRVGAHDDLASGQSTFMVEMSEAANIIRHATPRSLLLIDEIGRGTSTFDGMAIAAALAEHIHDHIQAFTIFSTHYHELTQLPEQKSGIQNFHVAVSDEGDSVVFLHQLQSGPAPGSYGIHVAKMAGLPAPLIQRAQALLEKLESSGGKLSGKAKQLQLF